MIEEYQPEPLLGSRSKTFLKWLLMSPFILLALLYVGYLLTSPSDPIQPKPTPVVNSYKPSPEMISYASSIGIPVSALFETKATITDKTTGICNPEFFEACYDSNSETIYLYPYAISHNPAGSLAYEYSHHIWKHMQPNEKAILKAELLNLYMASPKMQEIFKPIVQYEGSVGSDAFYDEVHSAACSQTNDKELSPALFEHCKSFLPNRTALPSLY